MDGRWSLRAVSSLVSRSDVEDVDDLFSSPDPAVQKRRKGSKPIEGGAFDFASAAPLTSRFAQCAAALSPRAQKHLLHWDTDASATDQPAVRHKIPPMHREPQGQVSPPGSTKMSSRATRSPKAVSFSQLSHEALSPRQHGDILNTLRDCVQTAIPQALSPTTQIRAEFDKLYQSATDSCRSAERTPATDRSPPLFSTTEKLTSSPLGSYRTMWTPDRRGNGISPLMTSKSLPNQARSQRAEVIDKALQRSKPGWMDGCVVVAFRAWCDVLSTSRHDAQTMAATMSFAAERRRIRSACVARLSIALNCPGAETAWRLAFAVVKSWHSVLPERRVWAQAEAAVLTERYRMNDQVQGLLQQSASLKRSADALVFFTVWHQKTSARTQHRCIRADTARLLQSRLDESLIQACVSRWREASADKLNVQVHVMRERLERVDAECCCLRTRNEELSERLQTVRCQTRLSNIDQETQMDAFVTTPRGDAEYCSLRTRNEELSKQLQTVDAECLSLRLRDEQTCGELARWRKEADDMRLKCSMAEKELLRRSGEEFAQLREVQMMMAKLQDEMLNATSTATSPYQIFSPHFDSKSSRADPLNAAFDALDKKIIGTGRADKPPERGLRLPSADEVPCDEVHDAFDAFEAKLRRGLASDGDKSSHERGAPKDVRSGAVGRRFEMDRAEYLAAISRCVKPPTSLNCGALLRAMLRAWWRVPACDPERSKKMMNLSIRGATNNGATATVGTYLGGISLSLPPWEDLPTSSVGQALKSRAEALNSQQDDGAGSLADTVATLPDSTVGTQPQASVAPVTDRKLDYESEVPRSLSPSPGMGGNWDRSAAPKRSSNGMQNAHIASPERGAYVDRGQCQLEGRALRAQDVIIGCGSAQNTGPVLARVLCADPAGPMSARSQTASSSPRLSSRMSAPVRRQQPWQLAPTTSLASGFMTPFAPPMVGVESTPCSERGTHSLTPSHQLTRSSSAPHNGLVPAPALLSNNGMVSSLAAPPPMYGYGVPLAPSTPRVRPRIVPNAGSQGTPTPRMALQARPLRAA